MKRIGNILIISLLAVMTFSSVAEAKKLKLFINNIKPVSGVSEPAAGKVRDFFSLSIFENFNKEYQIITDDDIKIMYKKAADIQASGCDAQTCILQIADAVNADEIIYGTMGREGSKIRLNVQNIKRNKETLEINKKSIVNELFYESQLEWYSKEIAKKLIDPGHLIDVSKAPSVVAGKFQVDKIDLKRVEGVDISIMSFVTNDESVSRIIDYLKEMVEKGDRLYKEKEYPRSREKYREVLKKINTKITESKRRKINSFIESVNKRIASTHINEFNVLINEVDGWLKEKGELDEEIMKEGLEKYNDIIGKLKKVPSPESDMLKDIESTLRGRLSSVYLAWVSIYEKEGDSYYSDYKFIKAIEMYEKGIKKIDKTGLHTEELMAKKGDLQKKRDAGMQTGRSWLENKVQSYCDQAEYFNIREKKGDAKDALEKAGWIIGANNLFLNNKIKTLYEEYSRLLGQKADIGEKTKFYQSGRDTSYGTYSISFMGLSALSLGGGYYFNMQLSSLTADYNSLADSYKVSTDFSEATKLHSDMTAKKEEADKAELYRNISYGAGFISLGLSVYFTYQYFKYRSVESDVKSASADRIFTIPLFSYGYGNIYSQNASRPEYFMGAVMLYRF